MPSDAPAQASPLRTIREARGMSLQRLSDLAGVDIAHISRVERGRSVPSVEVLGRLAQALGLRELEQMLAPYRFGPTKSESPAVRAQGSRGDNRGPG